MMKRLTIVAFVCLISSLAIAQIAATQDSSDKVLFAFAQGAQNNCAITAVIKDAIAIFGVDATNGVFASDDTEPDGSHDIAMRDGTRITVTKNEIEQATSLARYIAAPSHPMDKDISGRAYVMYAAMAKHAPDLKQLSVFEDAVDFTSSLQLLSDPGRNSDVLPVLLGLTCQEFSLNDTAHVSYVHANYYHAAFASLENYDQAGEKLPLLPNFQKFHKTLNPWKNNNKNWENFVLTAPSGPIHIADQNDPCSTD